MRSTDSCIVSILGRFLTSEGLGGPNMLQRRLRSVFREFLVSSNLIISQNIGFL